MHIESWYWNADVLLDLDYHALKYYKIDENPYKYVDTQTSQILFLENILDIVFSLNKIFIVKSILTSKREWVYILQRGLYSVIP